MLNRFRKRKAKQPEAAKDRPANTTMDPAMQLQCTYWTYNPDEKAALLARYPESLSWSEALRLHHLTCLELLSSEEGSAQLMGDLEGSYFAPKGTAYELCRELVQRLLSQDSPYRVRHCNIWQGEAGQSGQRPPDLQGQLRNASLTHLGCLEVIHLGNQNQVRELSFIPFDDIRGVLFAQPSLFRAGKVLYEDSSEEIVYIPLIYGVSWVTDIKYDHDGTMTRFRCHLPVDGLDMHIGIGIGIGHQDFLLTAPEAEGEYLLGLGSIGEIMFASELNDPKFDQRCRSRGLDPSTVRRQMAGK